jgi:hypothetical protein
MWSRLPKDQASSSKMVRPMHWTCSRKCPAVGSWSEGTPVGSCSRRSTEATSVDLRATLEELDLGLIASLVCVVADVTRLVHVPRTRADRTP